MKFTEEEALWLSACADSIDSLRSFSHMAWPLLNPGTPLVWGRHHDAICEHLEAITRGDITRLIINIPPGYSKTTLTQQTWPCWEWLHLPEKRWMFTAYAQDRTKAESLRRRSLMASSWYMSDLEPGWEISRGEDNKLRFANSRSGEMATGSVEKGVTGAHFDRFVIDDPLRASGIYTVELKNHVRWFNTEARTRVRDPKRSAFVIIMQRLHAKDLVGSLKDSEGDDWEILSLPERYEKRLHCSTSIGFEDWRTEEGELLFPERFDEDAIAQVVPKSTSPAVIRAQRQQDPVSDAGAKFKRTWWRYWTRDPKKVNTDPSNGPICVLRPDDDGFHAGVTSWDPNKTDSDTSDWTVGLAIAACGPDFFVLDERRARMEFPTLAAEVPLFAAMHARTCRKHLMEFSGNGIALCQLSPPPVAGLKAVKVGGRGKVQRADGILGYVASGNVYVPHPDEAEWVPAFIEEHADFPTGAHDDRVDALSQGLEDLGTLMAEGAAPYERPREKEPPPAKSPIEQRRRDQENLAKMERKALRDLRRDQRKAQREAARVMRRRR